MELRFTVAELIRRDNDIPAEQYVMNGEVIDKLRYADYVENPGFYGGHIETRVVSMAYGI